MTQIPTPQELEQNKQFEKTMQNGKVVYRRYDEFNKEKEKGEPVKRGRDVFEEYVYSNGKFEGGYVKGVRVNYQKRGGGYTQSTYVQKRYGVTDGYLVEDVYETVASSSGRREKVQFFERNVGGQLVEQRTNLTPTQKKNLRRQAEESARKKVEVSARDAQFRNAQVVQPSAVQRVQDAKVPTTRSEFAEDIFRRQGKVSSVDKGGRFVVAEDDGKTKVDANFIREEREKSFTGEKKIDENPSKTFEESKTSKTFEESKIPKGKTSLSEKESELKRAERGGNVEKAVFLGVGVSAVKYAKGFGRGFVSVFNPQTYVDLASLATKEGRSEAREGLQGVGRSIRADPTELFEIAGEFKGVEKGVNTLSKIPSGVRNVRGKIATQRLKAEFKNKVVTAQDVETALAKTSKGVSVEVKGRPVQSVEGAQVTKVTPKGTVQKGSIIIKTGDPEVIRASSAKWYIIEGERVRKLSVAGKNLQKVGSAGGKTEKVGLVVSKEKLVKILQEEAFSAKSGKGEAVITESRIADGNLFIKQTRVGSQGSSALIEQYEVARATISPLGEAGEPVASGSRGGFNPPKPKRLYGNLIGNEGTKSIGGSQIKNVPLKGGGVRTELYVFESAEILKKTYGTDVNPVIVVAQRVPIQVFNLGVRGKSTTKKAKKETPLKEDEKEVAGGDGTIQILKVETKKKNVPSQRKETQQVAEQKQKAEQAQGQKQEGKTLQEALQKQAQERFGQKQALKAEQKQKRRVVFTFKKESAHKLESVQIAEQEQKRGTIRKQEQNPILQQKQRAEQEQEQGQRQEQEQIIFPLLQTPGGGGRGRVTEEPPSKPKLIFPPSPVDERKRSRGSFELFVKRKGKFESVAGFSNPEQAVDLGAKIVQDSASASFKVEGDREEVERAGRRLLPQRKFRKSKVDEDVFVERRSERINTGGELREITFKGVFANKRKSVFGR